jgi:hypothetical protein
MKSYLLDHPYNFLLLNRVDKDKNNIYFHWENNITLFGTRIEIYLFGQFFLLSYYDLIQNAKQLFFTVFISGSLKVVQLLIIQWVHIITD